MSPALPFRSRARNHECATAAPMAVTILCSRPAGADAAQLILRDTFESTLPSAKRFATRMLAGAVQRHGLPLDVQVIDATGTLLWSKTAGGAR